MIDRVLPIAADPRLYRWEAIPVSQWDNVDPRAIVYRKVPTLLTAVRVQLDAAQGNVWLFFHDATDVANATINGRPGLWSLFCPAGVEASDVMTDSPIMFEQGLVVAWSSTGAVQTLIQSPTNVEGLIRLNSAPWDPASGQPGCFGGR